MTERYPEVARADLPGGLVLDGEIVALDGRGRPSFERLQSRMNRVPSAGETTVAVTYVVFDLLVCGTPIIDEPLEQRAERLAAVSLPSPLVRADRYQGESAAVWQFVLEHDLEGIVGKRLGSAYVPGFRSPDWRKMGNFKQLRAVVGGFTRGTGGRGSSFGALLLGLKDGDKLRWIGAVGTGFNNRSLDAIRSALGEMVTAECPFHPDRELPKASTWVHPKLVAMVRFKEWTAAGRVRAPSFLGFTDDPASAVTWEIEGP
jgi:bifunctional non-homologous end joining protein LigD